MPEPPMVPNWVHVGRKVRNSMDGDRIGTIECFVHDWLYVQVRYENFWRLYDRISLTQFLLTWSPCELPPPPRSAWDRLLEDDPF